MQKEKLDGREQIIVTGPLPVGVCFGWVSPTPTQPNPLKTPTGSELVSCEVSSSVVVQCSIEFNWVSFPLLAVDTSL